MSRATMILMSVTMLALSMACSAQAPKVIAEKLYDQVDQAVANHDLNQYLSFFDPSYVLIDERDHRFAFEEYRKQVEEQFTQARNLRIDTVVEDAQLEAGRMVVYLKSEARYEWHDPRKGWVPQIGTTAEEETWEKKGGQWRVVLSKTLKLKVRVDPEWSAGKAKLNEMGQKNFEEIIRNSNCMAPCP